MPAAEILFDSLPDSLSKNVARWMTEAVGSDGLAELQVLMAWSRVVLAQVELHSTLTVGALDDGGYARASHTLDGLVFHVGDEVIAEDIPQIESLPGAGHSEVIVRVQRDEEGLHLLMAQQRFGLLFGEAAYRAFQSIIQAHYGTDLRGVLGNAVDCASMATEVAARCAFDECVGHESELTELCNGALDSAAEQVHAQFAAFDIESPGAGSRLGPGAGERRRDPARWRRVASASRTRPGTSQGAGALFRRELVAQFVAIAPKSPQTASDDCLSQIRAKYGGCLP